ncbi:MAG: hypothetical protein IKT00_11570 [Prevotella sp.]|nr:hypothetical protein [Prevotella sp.]
MNDNVLSGGKTAKVARWTGYGLLAVIAVVFGLFFIIGYDRQYAENPNFREPLLTGVVVTFVLLMLLAAVVVALWSVTKSLQRRDDSISEGNGIPARYIAMAVAVATVLLLALTWIFGSKTQMLVNGNNFDDGFWLKTADMFVISILFMIAAAIAATLFATWRSRHNSQ